MRLYNVYDIESNYIYSNCLHCRSLAPGSGFLTCLLIDFILIYIDTPIFYINNNNNLTV